jgi:hypothetical protein
MKTKKFKKRLQINKTTVANLDVSEQKAARGGATLTNCSDPTNCDTYHDCDTTVGDFCTEGWYCHDTFACGTMVSPCDRTGIVCTDTDIMCR